MIRLISITGYAEDSWHSLLWRHVRRYYVQHSSLHDSCRCHPSTTSWWSLFVSSPIHPSAGLLFSCIFATPGQYYTARLDAHGAVTSYGDNWHESLQLSNILGSGCIAQVYKGKIEHNGNELLVAIKVKHPNVDDEIDSDLDIMRLSVYILERIPFDAFRNLRWYRRNGNDA